MALFKRLFFRKPPDGLLEITERVYVFDHCFSTDVLSENVCKENIRGTLMQIRSQFPDASCMVFNFSDEEGESQITSILSEFDITVMDYPRHYEGCPLLKMEMVHHFLRSCESWLCLGQQNLLLMHYERGGWPVMAFMLAALLIYLKQHTGERRTLDMIYKQAPHELLRFLSPLNPVPSQLRYLQYVSRSVASEWPPLDRALNLDCVILRTIPNFDSEGGCRPIFRIYGQDPFFPTEKTTKVLFSTPKISKLVRHYKQEHCELIKVDIGCYIQGDVVIECISLDEDLEREVMMFQVVLNTAFIRSNILMLNRDQVDILWDTMDQFPKDFRVEVLLSEINEVASLNPVELTHVEDKEGLPAEAFAKVHEIFNHWDWLGEKGDAIFHILQQITPSNFSEHLDKIPQQKSPTKKLQPDDKNDIVVSETAEANMSFSLSQLSNAAAPGLLESSEPSADRPLPQSPSLPPPPPPPPPLTPPPSSFKISRVSSPRLPERGAHIMQSAELQPFSPTLTPPLPPPPPSAPASQLPFYASSKQKMLLIHPAPEAPPPPPPPAAASCGVSPAPIPAPPPPPPKLAPHRSTPMLLPSPLPVTPFPSSIMPNTPFLPPSGKMQELTSTEPVSSVHLSQSITRSSSNLSSDKCNNVLVEHTQPLGCPLNKLPSTPPPPPPPPQPASSSPPLQPAIPSPPPRPVIPSPPHPPPSPLKRTRMTSTPSQPPSRLPHKKADVPSSSTSIPLPPMPPLTSSSGSGTASQSNTTQSVPPPPVSTLSPFTSSSSSKGRSLTHTRSPRSVHSTQSSSRRTSLKPLHWIKVTRAMSGSLWAETQKSDELSKTPEIDMSELESLFSMAVPNSGASGLVENSKRRASLAGKSDKVHLIDLRRANNCEIMLTKVKVPIRDLVSSMLALDDSILDIDQIENLIKFCPTQDEMELLQGYKGDKEALGKCEQFFLELMKVPRVESKLRVFSFKLQFHSQVADLKRDLNTIHSAVEEIRSSVKLKRIMQTILSLGNALNQGTARGSAIGFRLDSLLKLSDIRACNNKITLIHYLCKVIEDKLPEVIDFHKDLVSLEVASKLQGKILAEEMQAISKGVEKVEQELTSAESDGPVSETFRETLKGFLAVAEADVRSLTTLYTGVGRSADALARYFGEDPTRCPFEQVVSTLFHFTKTFERAHEENCKQLELERKKAQKEAEHKKLRLAISKKESAHASGNQTRSGLTR